MVSAPKNPTDLEIEVYKAMASLFNSEESAFWTRNNILAVIHGGLLAATAGIVANSEKALAADAPPFAATLLFGALVVLALVGLGMALAWRFMVARGEKIADTVSDKLKDIEREFAGRANLNFSTTFHAFVNFGDKLQTKPAAQLTPDDRFNNVRLSKIWGRVGQCLMWLWGALALLFALILLTGYARPHPPTQGAGATASSPDPGAISAGSNAASSATLSATLSAAMTAATTKAAAAAQAAADAAQAAASSAAAATQAVREAQGAAQQAAAAAARAARAAPGAQGGCATRCAAGPAHPLTHPPTHPLGHPPVRTPDTSPVAAPVAPPTGSPAHARARPCTCAPTSAPSR